MKIKIAVIGAGSEEFGPASVHDIFLSNLLCKQELEVVLMDINEKTLPVIQEYAEKVAAGSGLNETERAILLEQTPLNLVSRVDSR